MMKVELTLDLTDYDEQSISDQIVQNAAGQLRNEINSTLTTLIAKTVEDDIKSRAAILIDEIVARGIPQTNRFGEKQGETQSWVEFAVATTEKYLTENVDGRNGNKTDYHNRDHKVSRSQYLVSKIVKEAIEGKMSIIKDDIKQSLPGMMKDALAKLADKATP